MSLPARYVLPWASIDWQTPGTPASAAHGDIYWSKDRGAAEKQHVFINGSNLKARWKTLDAHHFTICEVGFGFGLNFLLAANLFRQQAGKGAILNYLAIEYAPVSPQDIAKAAALVSLPADVNPDLYREHCEKLVGAYPLPSPGFHCLWVDHNICLTLILGDVRDALPEIEATVDAWFLDGFSPAVNPDAWTGAFRHMARLGRPGTTVATYSVAGATKAGLAGAGFGITKQPGFGTKLEMLTGALPGRWQPRTLSLKNVAIIGAGLAGLACARALARRNMSVTLFDRAGLPLSGASAIPGLAVYPQLAKVPEANSLFSLAAFQYTQKDSADFRQTGRCVLASNHEDEIRLQAIGALLPDEFARYLSVKEAADLTGLNCRHPGLYFPSAGWRQPQTDHFQRFELITGCNVTSAGAGVVHFNRGDQRNFDAIIFAPGASDHALMSRLELMPVRGQSIEVSCRAPLTAVVGGPVSLIPFNQNVLVVGSTYENGDRDHQVREQDTMRLTKLLRRLTDEPITATNAFAGVRVASRDRFPVAGRLPDWQAFDSGRFNLYQDSTYLLTALGSHGATTTPLLGEYVARLVSGEPSCIGASWARKLDACRFAIRDARRGVTADPS